MNDQPHFKVLPAYRMHLQTEIVDADGLATAVLKMLDASPTGEVTVLRWNTELDAPYVGG